MESPIASVPTRYGMFQIDRAADKKMADALIAGFYPNEGLLAIARAFVNTESVVIDIGAHIGTFAVPIAGEVKQVIAFEPSTEAFPLLSRNVHAHAGKIRLVNAALGKEKGSGTLVVRSATNAGANTLLPGGDILVTTLDQEVSAADFIKIDVEGMEWEVLRGSEKLIEKSRPIVVFEVNLSQLRAHDASPRLLEKFFIEHGYRLYFTLDMERDGLSRVENATLLSAFIAPRAWLFFGDSAPFDLVAVPCEHSVDSHSFAHALYLVFLQNMRVKKNRMSRYFRRILHRS